MRIRIRIRIYGQKATRHWIIKIKAAKLIWPGGMSGAPESGAPCQLQQQGQRTHGVTTYLLLLFTNLDAKEDYFYQEDSYIYAEDEKEYENSSLSVLTPSLRQECFPASCNGKFCMDRCPCIEMNGELKPPPNKRNDSLSEGVEIKKGTLSFKKKFFH